MRDVGVTTSQTNIAVTYWEASATSSMMSPIVNTIVSLIYLKLTRNRGSTVTIPTKKINLIAGQSPVNSDLETNALKGV